jgi:hypothetical protein
VFGYPTTAQQAERVEAGTFQVQHFERHRLELHPENARPYDVLLGRLGADQLQQMRVASLPQEQRGGCLYFDQTRHTVCGRFANAWRANGLEFDGQPGKSFDESLALFGLPLTHEMIVPLADGKQHIVQYFERARFELHPDNYAPFTLTRQGSPQRWLGNVAFELGEINGWSPDGSGFLLRGTFGDPIGRVKTVWVPLEGGAPYEINSAGYIVSWGR